jgi:hypothetical protein
VPANRPLTRARHLGPADADAKSTDFAGAAYYLLSIYFTAADNARMQELIDQSNEDVLTPDETAELDGYVNIESIPGLE